MAILYDQFGREIKVEKRPERREIATVAIRDRWSSYPSKNLTPEKLAKIFLEADGGDVYRQSELFEEMEEKDAHLFSQLQTRKNAVMGIDYEIQPYEKGAENQRIADFVADVFYDLADFDDTLMDLLDAVGKGFALSEIMWDTDSGKSVIAKFNHIHQKRAVFSEWGQSPWAKDFQAPRITTEAEPFKGEDLPPFKLAYHRYKARSGYDTRAGVLRVCSWMYLFKNHGIKDWVVFLEVFGMPLRLGKHEPGASQDDRDALVAAIQSLGSDAAGIISKNTEIEFIEAIRGRITGNPYKEMAEFCDKQMSKAVLGQTASSEGTPGKLGSEDAQDHVRRDLIKADCEALMKTVRFQMIRPLVGYNFGWDKPLPWFVLKFEPPEDLKMLSDVYVNLSKIGHPITAEHVSERFKIPMPQKGETVLQPAMSPAAFKYALKSTPMRAFSPEQEKIEGLVARAEKQAQNALSGILEPVKAMVLSANSLTELRDGILDAYGDLDPDELQELIARAMFVAELYGRATVAE